MKKKLSKKIKQNLIKISKKHELDLLILFGSYAKGCANKNSDYDLAFYIKEKLDNKQKSQLEDDIFEILEYKDFDLIEINELINPILLFDIFHEGVCIYQSNEKYFEIFKENSYFDYIDSNNLLRGSKEKFLSNKI